MTKIFDKCVLKNFFLIFSIAFFLNLSLSANGISHPHAWIIYEIKPRLNLKKEVLGLEQTWTFDPYYSVFLLEEQKRLGKASKYQMRLNKLGNFMLLNMAKVGYFTRLNGVNSNKAKFIYLKDLNSRIQMKFYLPFKKPVKKGVKFTYKVYDPTYYIDMQHKKKHRLKFGSCHLNIVKSNPGQKIIDQALALDKIDTPQSNLGILFTDKGVLKCK